MNSVIAVFCNIKTGVQKDLEIPLDITANELFIAVNKIFNLNKDTNDMSQCYLKCENPIVLLKGNRTLEEFGIHNGSYIMFD